MVRAIVQRAKQASVAVAEEVVGEIGQGLVVFLGVEKGDAEKDAQYLAQKVAHLRIFGDASGKFNLSALEVAGQMLVVSQFTLLGEARKGRRPNFTRAAPPEEAHRWFQRFVDLLRNTGLNVETGRFGEHMRVLVDNDGPVTILLDSRA